MDLGPGRRIDTDHEDRHGEGHGLSHGLALGDTEVADLPDGRLCGHPRLGGLLPKPGVTYRPARRGRDLEANDVGGSFLPERYLVDEMVRLLDRLELEENDAALLDVLNGEKPRLAVVEVVVTEVEIEAGRLAPLRPGP